MAKKYIQEDKVRMIKRVYALCKEYATRHGLSTKEFYKLANISKGQYDAMSQGNVTQEVLYRIGNVLGIDIYTFVPIIDELGHERDKKGTKEKPAEMIELDIPSFEAVDIDNTIEDKDVLVTKGMLNDLLRNFLYTCLDMLNE